MSVYEKTFAIRVLAITAGAWTDVVGEAVLPIGCDLVTIYNNSGVDVLLRTDPNNANSQVTIASGQAFEIGSPGRRPLADFRFPVNSTYPVCSLQSSVGNVNVLVESLQ